MMVYDETLTPLLLGVPFSDREGGMAADDCSTAMIVPDGCYGAIRQSRSISADPTPRNSHPPERLGIFQVVSKVAEE